MTDCAEKCLNPRPTFAQNTSSLETCTFFSQARQERYKGQNKNKRMKPINSLVFPLIFSAKAFAASVAVVWGPNSG
jgi:hypothetical protein